MYISQFSTFPIFTESLSEVLASERDRTDRHSGNPSRLCSRTIRSSRAGKAASMRVCRQVQVLQSMETAHVRASQTFPASKLSLRSSVTKFERRPILTGIDSFGLLLPKQTCSRVVTSPKDSGMPPNNLLSLKLMNRNRFKRVTLGWIGPSNLHDPLNLPWFDQMLGLANSTTPPVRPHSTPRHVQRSSPIHDDKKLRGSLMARSASLSQRMQVELILLGVAPPSIIVLISIARSDCSSFRWRSAYNAMVSAS